MPVKWWHDGGHPIWKIALIVVFLAGAWLLSYLNASNFDETEHRFLLQLAGWVVGGGGAIHLLSGALERGKDDK